jgi:pyruvate/2-oxoglutarate dehydrogenase complex dihydrolipoamide acyltransferase (E2) component
MADRVLISIPHETVNDETVRILSWKFASGSLVRKDELICEAETSKAVMEIHAPEDGTLIYSASVGDEVPVGAPICEILPGGQLAAPDELRHSASNGDSRDSAAPSSRGPARLTPLALKVAADFGVDISDFAPGTLVRRKDVLRKAGKLPREEERAAAPARDPAKSARVVSGAVDWEELPRRKIVEGGILAAGQAGSVSSFVSTVCRAPGLRSRTAKMGFPPVAFNALIVFEAARLLRKYPVFNAVFDGSRMGRYREVNIGWAIDGGGKLVVPVVREADRKTIAGIAAVMQEQLERYVEDSLAPADFSGGTFTVTDLSGDGITFFQPLISQGQSAILGVGSDRSQGEEVFYLTLAFDHQLTEGRTASRFLAELRERLEAHSTLESDAAASPEPFCLLCQRDSRELAGIKAILLKSERPSGFVCSFCVAGWL